MSVTDWSVRQDANATADASIPIQDSTAARNYARAVRGVMASVAAYVLDQSGGLVTSSTGDAYKVSTNAGLSSLKPGVQVSLLFDSDNEGAATLNVDGLGARPLCDAGGAALSSGQIKAGRLSRAVWDAVAEKWRLDTTYGVTPDAILGASPVGRAVLEGTAPQARQALDLGNASVLNRTQLSAPNLFSNSDFTDGSSDAVLCPNDALDVVNVRGWVTQQSTLTPFMSLTRVIAPGGGFGLRLTNGIPSGSTATIANTGSVTFSVPPDHNFQPGIEVTAAYALDPSVLMRGLVTAITSNTVTIAPTFVNGGGTYSEWAIGREGVTTKGQTFRTTSQASAAGTKVLYIANTAGIDIGAAVEKSDVNNIAKATYVVSKTATTVTVSKPFTGPIAENQSVTFYGAQGIYAYQNIPATAAKDFKNGTPYARTSYFSFGCRSFYCEGTRASVMVLGYKSLFELGTSYAEAFDITPAPTRVSVPILGDKVGAPNTWVAGYDALDGYPYMCVGPCWESNDTPTSRNIPVGQWRPDVFAVGGSDQQTLALSARVGSWVEFWEPKLEFDTQTSYRSPDTTIPPVEEVRIKAPVNPLRIYHATRNAAGVQKCFDFLDSLGSLWFGPLADDERSSGRWLGLMRNGSVRLPAYPAGDAVFSADGTFGSVPSAFTAYASDLALTAGSATFTGSTLSFRRKLNEVEVEWKIAASAVTPPSPDNGAGFLTVNLPGTLPADATGATFAGWDSGFYGEPVFCWVPPNGTRAQVFRLGTRTDGSFGRIFPLRTGSNLIFLGRYRTA